MPPVHPDYLSFFDWIWSTSLKVSFLVILLLLMKLVVKNRIGARLHYWLWVAVFVSLLVPWAPQSSLSIYNLTNLDIQNQASFHGEKETPLYPSAAAVGINEQEKVNNLNQIAAAPKPGVLHNMGEPHNALANYRFIHRLLFFLWLTGVAVLFMITGLINRRFAKNIQCLPVVDTHLVSIEKAGIDDPEEYAFTLLKLAESNLKVSRIVSVATLTNAKVSPSGTAGKVAAVTNDQWGEAVAQSDQSSAVPQGGFNYRQYLPFTPLLPSYTAGYQLTTSQISCSQNMPPDNTSGAGYLAAYGSHAAFTITEGTPRGMEPNVSDHSTKQVLIASKSQRL